MIVFVMDQLGVSIVSRVVSTTGPAHARRTLSHQEAPLDSNVQAAMELITQQDVIGMLYKVAASVEGVGKRMNGRFSCMCTHNELSFDAHRGGDRALHRRIPTTKTPSFRFTCSSGCSRPTAQAMKQSTNQARKFPPSTRRV